jgi:hypothetical protein
VLTPPVDAGHPDSGFWSYDAGPGSDAGAGDAGGADAGPADGGGGDAGVADAGPEDAGTPVDAGFQGDAGTFVGSGPLNAVNALHNIVGLASSAQDRVWVLATDTNADILLTVDGGDLVEVYRASFDAMDLAATPAGKVYAVGQQEVWGCLSQCTSPANHRRVMNTADGRFISACTRGEQVWVVGQSAQLETLVYAPTGQQGSWSRHVLPEPTFSSTPAGCAVTDDGEVLVASTGGLSHLLADGGSWAETIASPPPYVSTSIIYRAVLQAGERRLLVGDEMTIQEQTPALDGGWQGVSNPGGHTNATRVIGRSPEEVFVFGTDFSDNFGISRGPLGPWGFSSITFFDVHGAALANDNLLYVGGQQNNSGGGLVEAQVLRFSR